MWTTVPPAKSSEGMWPPIGVEQAADAPDHVRHGAVDKERPEREKQGHGAELHALGKCAGDQGRRDDGEHELVDHVGLLGNGGGVVGVRGERDAAQEGVLEAADKHVAVAEGQRVADNGPENCDQAHHGEALHHGAENVFAAHQAAVEERQAGAGHQQHQRGRGEHPGVVAGGLSALDGLLKGGDLGLGGRSLCSGLEIAGATANARWAGSSEQEQQLQASERA